MVITINGIEKMKGHLFCGREVADVKDMSHFGTEHYTFHFNSIGNKTTTHMSWEDKFVIHLSREPKNGIYELYWMGLHGVTCQQLDVSQVRNFQTFYSYFEKVIRLAKEYWDESIKN